MRRRDLRRGTSFPPTDLASDVSRCPHQGRRGCRRPAGTFSILWLRSSHACSGRRRRRRWGVRCRCRIRFWPMAMPRMIVFSSSNLGREIYLGRLACDWQPSGASRPSQQRSAAGLRLGDRARDPRPSTPGEDGQLLATTGTDDACRGAAG